MDLVSQLLGRGEMARVDSLGPSQATDFWKGCHPSTAAIWPSVYGIRNYTVLTAHEPGGPDSGDSTNSSEKLLSGTQLVLFDSAARSLESINLRTGRRTFAYRAVQGASPDFELLRHGGVAWTAQLPGAGMLGAVDGQGAELLTCLLPSPVASRTAIIRGRAYMASKGEIVVYDVPGLDVEPGGWVTKSGSLRGPRAR